MSYRVCLFPLVQTRYARVVQWAEAEENLILYPGLHQWLHFERLGQSEIGFVSKTCESIGSACTHMRMRKNNKLIFAFLL